ncbi:MAG: hypothetical protein ACLRWP_12420 [Bilophila wadsworthia]
MQSPYEQAGFLIGGNRTATEDETGVLILIGDLIGFLHRGCKPLDLQEFPSLSTPVVYWAREGLIHVTPFRHLRKRSPRHADNAAT